MQSPAFGTMAALWQIEPITETHLYYLRIKSVNPKSCSCCKWTPLLLDKLLIRLIPLTGSGTTQTTNCLLQ
jgi:hypothetical protein